MGDLARFDPGDCQTAGTVAKAQLSPPAAKPRADMPVDEVKICLAVIGAARHGPASAAGQCQKAQSARPVALDQSDTLRFLFDSQDDPINLSCHRGKSRKYVASCYFIDIAEN